MNKTWLIIQREYITRVRNKTFILSTILTPLFFAGLIAASAYFSMKMAEKHDSKDRATEIIEKTTGGKPEKEKGIAYVIGYASSFAIYITILIYGTMVMRGVSEEKTNRVAEIIISSVKPFQLMMGKIVGIGAVGLTQFFIWIIMLVVLSAGLAYFIPPDLAPNVGSPGPSTEAAVQQALSSVRWAVIIPSFIFYFIFGYLFYASLFAAVGSAVSEDAQDTQSLMVPITMPIVLAIVIMMSAIVNPDGSLAVWSSMIPFFSPVVMMARLPFGVPAVVPWWQLALSMAVLVGSFLFVTWLSARIYRTGILLYGKKVTWREMWKWGFRS